MRPQKARARRKDRAPRHISPTNYRIRDRAGLASVKRFIFQNARADPRSIPIRNRKLAAPGPIIVDMVLGPSINGSNGEATDDGMNCEILDILYIRSNGEIPCNCSFGEQINLDWAKSDADWDIDEVFYNRKFAHIRESFKQGKMPWKECADCAFLNRDEPVRDLIAQKRISKVHLEPSLACKLRCPGCSRVEQAKTRLSPFFMDPAVWERVLASLSEKSYAVDLFFYCGQGEPINNPRFNELVQLTNQYYPDTEQAVNTNGNHDYPSTIGKLGADRPDLSIVSIDGLY